MKVDSIVTEIFNTSLERAFKTPILGDATKFMTGYGVIPAVTGFTDDETWGKAGGHRIPHSTGNIFTPKGEVGYDEILVREDNKYWKWEVRDFEVWSMFFLKKAQGQFFFEEKPNGTISVMWVYSLYSRNLITYPFTWVFTTIFWNGLQKKAIKKIKHLAETEADYIYS